MIRNLRKLPRAALRITLLVRLGWTGCALALLAAFFVLHLLGWRDDTAIISGTLADGSPNAAIMRGVLYAFAYFAAVVIGPILLLAAGIKAIFARVRPAGKSLDSAA